MGNERVEAEFTVPASTSVSASNSGGGPTTVNATAGASFISDLVTDLQTQLNNTRAPNPGTWSVARSTTTGLITIDCPSGAVVTKSGGSGFAWDAGVSSTESIAGDGYLEVTASETATFRKVGLATAAIGVDHTLIKWGLYLRSAGAIYTSELGAEVDTGATYVSGDTLTIKRTGTTVTYLKNGTVIATSGVSSSGTLVVGAAALSSSATLCALRLYSAGVRSALTMSASLSNVTVTATTYSIAWTSTTLRNTFGFAADITAVNAPQTGASIPSGIWSPGCSLLADSDPKQAPTGDDKSASISPTGRAYFLASSEFFRHRNVRFPMVSKDRVWANDATTVGADWQTFYLDTQLAHHSWFNVGSRVKVYWIDAGTPTEMGSGDVEAWTMPRCVTLDELKFAVNNWTGLVEINLGDMYADE